MQGGNLCLISAGTIVLLLGNKSAHESKSDLIVCDLGETSALCHHFLLLTCIAQ